MGQPRALVRKLVALPILTLVAIVSQHKTSQAAIKVVLTYTFVENEVAPHQRLHRDHRSVSFLIQGRALTVRMTNGVSNSGDIGRNWAATNLSNDPYVNRVDISRANEITVTSTYPSYVITTVIQTNGADQCTATRDVRIRPGHQFFENTRISNHEHILLSDMRFEDVSCAISN